MNNLLCLNKVPYMTVQNLWSSGTLLLVQSSRRTDFMGYCYCYMPPTV